MEFCAHRGAPPVRIIRVLVRNADSLVDAIIRGVTAAIEIDPAAASITRAVAADWCRVDLDLVA